MQRRALAVALFLCGMIMSLQTASSFIAKSSRCRGWRMVLASPVSRGASLLESAASASIPPRQDPTSSLFKKQSERRRVKSRYKRKRIPETEKELTRLRQKRQAKFDRILEITEGSSQSVWSFESLFPEPVVDEETVKRDLFAIKEQDQKTTADRKQQQSPPAATASQREKSRMKNSYYGGSSMMRVWRERRLSSAYIVNEDEEASDVVAAAAVQDSPATPAEQEPAASRAGGPGVTTQLEDGNVLKVDISSILTTTAAAPVNATTRVDRDLTRMVENRLFGFRRAIGGNFEYETSLMDDGAVKFRDGVRLGNPLRVNADRLTYHAKKELQHGRVEEAQEFYERALTTDPRDGRAYLGLSRCAQRRRDFKLAREILQAGIANSITSNDISEMTADRGANPFLLQALGCLEERMGHLSRAEDLYISAARSRPSHAAAWVALAQLRTRKLGQTASSGRVCYETAERELRQAGLPPSAYVYTAWASMEYHKAGDTRRARELFKKALKVDKRCSAAWLQLGVMLAHQEEWKEAQECFESVLKFDQRNSRVLQAYALMESKRPDGSSRTAIDLFERALLAKPRDAAVLQAYALYVADLGDLDAARDLLLQGTKVNKRHAPVWQAWGVLETRHGSAEDARKIFQQGIWACAQLSGSQSGGYRCARLWQAWGCLEAREEEYAAARRCFSRALDADSRNVAAITAWAQMEHGLDNIHDARAIFEDGLSRFAPGSNQKLSLWRSYELMEQSTGNNDGARQVYSRSMREAMAMDQAAEDPATASGLGVGTKSNEEWESAPERAREVEVVRWEGGGGEVWLNDNAIEGKVPFDMKRRRKSP